MKKTSLSLALAAAALAVPGMAVAHGKPEGAGAKAGKAEKPAGKSGKSHGKSRKCKTRSVAYVVGGTVVASDLRQTSGQDTAKTSDDRYSGTVTLDVTRANRRARALKGTQQALDVTDVRVSYGDGVVAPAPAGTLVQLLGKVTTVSKKCADTSEAGVVTFRKVAFEAASATDTGDDPAAAPAAS